MKNQIKVQYQKIKARLFSAYYKLISSGHIDIVSVQQQRNVSIRTYCGGYITAKKGLVVRNNTTIHSFGGKIEMGENVFFNTNCNLICRESIKLGNSVLIGPNVSIYDHNHTFSPRSGRPSGFSMSGIIIEDCCWICAGAVILKGTHIGKGCIIGANAVVGGTIPPHSIVTQGRELNIRPIEKTEKSGNVAFNIKLAGISIGVNALFASTKDFCKEYLTEDATLFSVAIAQTDIDSMRESARKTELSDGYTPIDYFDSYLETLALADAVLTKLLNYGIVMFHGSVMAVDGKAYMFTAKSGTGKTTHSRLWLKNIPDCHILNGDKPLLLFKNGKVYACGSPWMGKEEYGVNEILPLQSICILERDKTNHIEKIDLKDSLSMLLRQCNIPGGNKGMLAVINLMQQLSSVSLYRLGCNMEDEAAFVSYNAMVKNASRSMATEA